MPKMAEELDGTRFFLHHSTQIPPTNGDSPYETKPGKLLLQGSRPRLPPELGSPTIPIGRMPCAA